MATKGALGVLAGAALLALAGLVTGCCGRGCGLREGEKSFEKWDGSVKASLVRTTTWKSSGTKLVLPIPSSNFVIRVETTPPFEEPTDCEKVVFADDGKGKTLAFRCHDQAEWTALRLRGGDARVRECKAPLGDAKKPDFRKLTPLSVAAPRIVACQAEGESYGNAQLTKAIAEEEGEGALLGFAAFQAARAVPLSGGDPWHQSLGLLPPSLRERALAALCAGLLPGAAPIEKSVYLRAVGRCRLEDPRVGDGALALLQQIVNAPVDPGYKPDLDRRDALSQTVRWAAALATRHRPVEAGALACGALPTSPENRLREVLYAPLLTILGRTGTRCDRLPSFGMPTPCGSSVECGKELCSAVALAVDTQEWATFDFRERPFDGPPRSPLAAPDVFRSLLHAYRANGPLPRSFTLLHARRHYPVVIPKPQPPTCDDSLAPNVPCSCRDEIAGSWAVCSVGLDDTRGQFGRCGFHIDDAKKRIDDVRLVCKTAGATCDDVYDYCCSGLVCAPDGQGDRSCQAGAAMSARPSRSAPVPPAASSVAP